MKQEFVGLTPFFFVRQSALYHTNSGIVIAGEDAALIDPAVAPEEIEAIGAFVQGKGATVQAILLTHSHWDHILGPEHFPGVRLVAHRTYTETVEAERRGLYRALAEWEREAGITRTRPFAIPRPDQVFDATCTIQVGSETFELIYAPGHHRDQYVVFHPGSGLLWAADMLSDLEIPFIEQEVASYRTSLDMISRLPDVRILVPGHGSWTSDADEIRERLLRDQAYLTELEAMIQICLRDGLSVEQTVEQCSHMRFHHPEDNAQAHRDNVETVWLELGGVGDAASLGWGKYYPNVTARFAP